MSPAFMTQRHQVGSPLEYTLGAGEACRIGASARERWLAVDTGRVWLTRSGAGPEGGDLWLDAGDRVALPAGSEWVVEAWPQARVALIDAPAGVAVPRRHRPWWTAWAARAPWARPAAG